MSTFSRAALSGGANGLMVPVVATSSPGTTVHTAVATTGADNWDEIYLWAVNSTTAAVKLTVQWGGTTSPANDMEVTIPGEAGLYLVVPGLPIQNGLLVRAFAGTASVVNVAGYVNQQRV